MDYFNDVYMCKFCFPRTSIHVYRMISLMLRWYNSPVKVCMWDANGYEPSKTQNIFRVEDEVLPCQDFQTWQWMTVIQCHAKQYRGQNILVADSILDAKLDCLPLIRRRLKQPVSFYDHLTDCWSILPLLVHPLHVAGRPGSCAGARCARHAADTRVNPLHLILSQSLKPNQLWLYMVTNRACMCHLNLEIDLESIR